MKHLIPLLVLAACASAPEKTAAPKPAAVSNETFKKEKPLTNAQVADFYATATSVSTPALQDETLDRYSEKDLAAVKLAGDPLLEISVRCARREFAEAFKLAASSFHRYQKVAAYWNQVANCHLNTGAFRKALLFYNKALEVSPNYVPALNNIGVMYSRQGQDQKALVAFERANREARFAKTPRYNLARLYLTYGLAEAALPLFQGLLGEAPNDVDLLTALATTQFILADYPRALETFRTIPEAARSRAEVGLNLALTLKHLGKTAEAEKVFAGVSAPATANLKRYYGIVRSQLGGAK
jgi:tetratricopeptide (TPR) repeat protein